MTGSRSSTIAFSVVAGSLSDRFATVAVDVPDSLVEQLRSVCTSVLDDDEARAEAGRGWWPLTMRWALAGEVPARPAVVAVPRSTEEVSGVLAACDAARVPVTAVGGRSG